MRASKVLSKLRSGKVALGVGVNLGPSILSSGLVGKLDYDFTFIDMEHRWFSHETIVPMILSAREGGADSIVRLADTQPSSIHRCFEIGATGVLIPHCESAAEARDLVTHAKFHPIGSRGVEPVSLDADFGTVGIKALAEWHNQQSLACVMIEDRKAVENLDEIVEVPGLDVLFVGLMDLAQSYGQLGSPGAPAVVEAVKKVAQVCRRAKKWWGLPVMMDLDKFKSYIDMGARFFVVMSDYKALSVMLKSEKEKLGGYLAGQGLG